MIYHKIVGANYTNKMQDITLLTKENICTVTAHGFYAFTLPTLKKQCRKFGLMTSVSKRWCSECCHIPRKYVHKSLSVLVVGRSFPLCGSGGFRRQVVQHSRDTLNAQNLREHLIYNLNKTTSIIIFV